MDMTEKNGQPSMEEILASIRRIVAEEPDTQMPHAHAGAPVIDFRHNPITLNGDGVLDDTSEFDLPAIFRSSSTPQPEKPGPLIGRLTDAIRNATSAQSRPKHQPETRQMSAIEEVQDRNGETSTSRFGGQSESYQALSSLKTTRPGESGLEDEAKAEAKAGEPGVELCPLRTSARCRQRRDQAGHVAVQGYALPAYDRPCSGDAGARTRRRGSRSGSREAHEAGASAFTGARCRSPACPRFR